MCRDRLLKFWDPGKPGWINVVNDDYIGLPENGASGASQYIVAMEKKIQNYHFGLGLGFRDSTNLEYSH